MPDSLPVFWVGAKGQAKAVRWAAVREDDLAERFHPSRGFNTVLAVNFQFDSDNPPPADALYKGPFYVDIDCEESLATSIRAARKVVKTLTSNGVRGSDIRIWATGKKGFHILLPPAIFGGTPQPNLAMVYKNMAIDMRFPDVVDFSVYSGGRGRMWRLPGRKRPDNAKYKVPLTVEELEELNVEGYNSLICEPREEFEWPKAPVFSAKMATLYQRALAKSKIDQEKLVKKFVDPDTVALLHGELPPCGKMMLEGKVRKELGYNAASMQFAKVVATFAPWDYKRLIREFAENTNGTNYNTVEKREKHTLTAYRIASKNHAYEWSCRSAQSVLPEYPCFDCPVGHLALSEAELEEIEKEGPAIPAPEPVHTEPTQVEPVQHEQVQAVAQAPQPVAAPQQDLGSMSGQTPAPEPEPAQKQAPEPEPVQDQPDEIDHYNEQGVIATDTGYAFVGDKDGVVRQVSNFVLKLEKYYVQYMPSVDADRRTACMAMVFIGSKGVGSVILEEHHWKNKQAFISAFEGLSNAGFYGKDDDIQKLRIVLMDKIEDKAEKIRRVASAGLHIENVADTWVKTWVEPGYSIDNFGSRNTYTLISKDRDYYPKHRFVDPPEPQDNRRLAEVFHRLFTINEPLNTSLMIGYYVACHIKPHLMAGMKEFPFLSVSGNAGAGKTASNELMASVLHGSAYHKGASSIDLPSVTFYVLWASVAASQNIPVLMDEYNSSKLGPRKYTDISEVLKSSYQDRAVSRGRVTPGKGVDIEEYPLTAPITVMSEQMITMPALIHRSVSVAMKPAGRNQKTDDNFYWLTQNWELNEKVALMLMRSALELDPEVAMKWRLKEINKVPYKLGARPQKCYATVLTGFDFLQYVSDKYQWGLGDLIQTMRSHVLGFVGAEGVEPSSDSLSTALYLATSKSEVDLVLDTLAELAAAFLDERASNKLEPDIHYKVKDGYLYLMGILCYSEYRRYVSLVMRKSPAIESLQVFLSLIRNEPYCQSVEAILPGFSLGRPVIKLSLSGLREKGVDTSMFIED